MIRAAIIFAMLVLARPAVTQENVDCTDPQAQQDMNICAYQDFEAADAELNAAWKEARASAKEMDAQYEADMKGAEKALLAGQRGWIAYRDGHCELAGWEAHGGSMEPMLVSGCMAELTRERTKQLQALVSAEQQ